MSVRIEKSGPVWTIILSRPEARNAIDPPTADALYRAFTEFDRDASAAELAAGIELFTAEMDWRKRAASGLSAG